MNVYSFILNQNIKESRRQKHSTYVSMNKMFLYEYVLFLWAKWEQT